MTLTGTAPLILHNVRLVDPLDPIVKQIGDVSRKVKKTDTDHLEMARLEFIGGIYHNEEIGPYLPGTHFKQSLVKAAGLSKGGQKIKRGVALRETMMPLDYDGPRDVETLSATPRYVLRVAAKVGQARVMRTRPWFPEWRVQATLVFEPSIINYEELVAAAQIAGQMMGVGDWRPEHGRFTVEASAPVDAFAEAA